MQQQYDYGYGEFNTSSGAVDTSKNNGQIGKVLGTIGTTAQWNQGFSYDELGRISNVVEHQGSTMSTQTYSQSYTYDRYANRFQSANSTLGLPAVLSSEIVASTNRFIATGSTPTTYDNAGNITTDTKFRGMSYAYDANGRQTSATNGTWTQSQFYDCSGQRVQTTVGSTTRTMVYDIFGQDVADYSGSSLERENIYRGGTLVATYEAGTSAIKYVLTDAQGSTRAVMNNSGGSSTVIARHDYLPFGEEIASGIGLRTTTQAYGAGDTNRQKYGLTERDDTTSLDHTWFRKYDSFAGRWTSPDPYNGSAVLGNPQSFNRYSYVHNDPVNFIDPSGLLPSAGCTAESSFADCYGSGGGGFWGGGWNFNDRGRPGQDVIGARENERDISIQVTRQFGYIPANAHYLGGLTWGWTDYSQDSAPSYSYSFRLARLNSLTVWSGRFGFDGATLFRGVDGYPYEKGGLDMHPPMDPVWLIAGGIAGGMAGSLRGAAQAEAGQPIRIYSARVLLKAVRDPLFHGFPQSFDAVIFQGQRSVISSSYTLFTRQGSVNGIRGVFEIGVRETAAGNQLITHRFFNPF